MKKLKYISIVVAGSMMLSACEGFFNSCLEGDGVLILEERAVTEFTGVVNTTSLDVSILYAENQLLTVEADRNLQSIIRTSVKGGDLYIELDEDECIDTRHNLRVDIQVPYLNRVELQGSGDMDVRHLNVDQMILASSGSGDMDVVNLLTDELEVTIIGSGDVFLEGKAPVADYWLSGSGDLRADDFMVEEAYMNLSGSGDAYVYALDLLDVVLSGSGYIYYRGDPVVVDRITGSGKIIRR